MSKRGKRLEQMAVLYPNAAGLDIGAREIYACVPPNRAEENVKIFGTFTPDLNLLADWLAENDVDTVATILLANPGLGRWGKYSKG